MKSVRVLIWTWVLVDRYFKMFSLGVMEAIRFEQCVDQLYLLLKCIPSIFRCVEFSIMWLFISIVFVWKVHLCFRQMCRILVFLKFIVIPVCLLFCCIC